MNKMEELEQLAEKHVSTKPIFDGVILHIAVDTVMLPDGKTATRELNRHLGAVCVVPVTDDGKVILERQYRYAIGQVITEIPAGKLDYPEEDRLSAAKRELMEETGYTADHWTDLGLYYGAPAYSDEKISMYLATGLHAGAQKLDEGEFLQVYEVPLEEAVASVLSGEIIDGKTQSGVLKAAALLAGEKTAD